MMDENTVSFDFVTQIREDTDSFIIETISPFCEETMKCELSKDDIRRAFTLLLAERNGQIEKRKEAEWLPEEFFPYKGFYCSNSDCMEKVYEETPYCPYCGAKMKGEWAE